MSFLAQKTNETRQMLALESGRNPVTCQVASMAPEDRKAYIRFTAEYTSALNPEGIVEIQLARTLAQDTWRINRCHAIEENVFALAHSEKFANIESSHPEIHAAMVQALRYLDDPRVFTCLALYEQRITKMFHANMKLLLHLQSLRRRAPEKEKEKEKAMSAAGAGSAYTNQAAIPDPTPQSPPAPNLKAA